MKETTFGFGMLIFGMMNLFIFYIDLLTGWHLFDKFQGVYPSIILGLAGAFCTAIGGMIVTSTNPR